VQGEIPVKTSLVLLTLLFVQPLIQNVYAGNDPNTLLELASDPIVTKALYMDSTRLLSGVGNVAENGAVAENAISGSSVNVESQRWGADLVQAALVTQKDPSQAIKVSLFGLSHEQPDGSFGPENDFQHISFFLEGAARTFLLLQQSHNPAYASLIAEAIPKLDKAAKSFISSGDLRKQENKGMTFTHRFFLLAAGLGEVAALTGDKTLEAEAQRLARQGLSRQLADGTNPEKGGFDLNYNATSGLFAERYYMVCPDHSLKLELKDMIRKTLRREEQAVLPNGDLSIEGSTRTGQDLEHNGSGRAKGRDTKGILQMFAFGSEITQKPQFEDIAQKIAAFRGWWN
jgi:hypothetical protein